MSLKYEVRNPFSCSQGTFSAGTLISAEQVAEWPTETILNRVVNGDIAPVKVTEGVVEESSNTGSPTETVGTDQKTTRKGK